MRNDTRLRLTTEIEWMRGRGYPDEVILAGVAPWSKRLGFQVSDSELRDLVSPPAPKPLHPASSAGLRPAIVDVGWPLPRWNEIGRFVEVHRADADEWEECYGLIRDLLMDAVASGCTMMRRGGVAPWRVSKRLEDRLLRVVAVENAVVQGAGSAVYDACCEYLGASLTGGGRVAQVTEVLLSAGVLQSWEVAPRAPKSVFLDGQAALRTKGWEWSCFRPEDGNPIWRWVEPITTTSSV